MDSFLSHFVAETLSATMVAASFSFLIMVGTLTGAYCAIRGVSIRSKRSY